MVTTQPAKTNPDSLDLESSDKYLIEVFKAYLEVSKQLDWVMFGFVPAIFIFGGMIMTFTTRLIELSIQRQTSDVMAVSQQFDPPSVMLGFAGIVAFLTCLLAIIGVAGLKRDQIRLWRTLSLLEQRLKLGLLEPYFTTKMSDFPEHAKPLKRKLYVFILVVLFSFEAIFLGYSVVCFGFPELLRKILIGLI